MEEREKNKKTVTSREARYGFYRMMRYLREKFDLGHDKARQDEVVDNINKGVEFSGPNLWVLIFASLIASLGLNVNSAAVIIGAMLISPLMGPIMGIGLSLGINDFELMKRSFRNFALMVVTSIVTAMLFFSISPLNAAQSELLARTSPTVYDVLIAFIGGLAGFLAQSRRDRTSTVIPGVAIATALMPPLCTAGYGLATGQFNYFIGAFYLFFINTVFITIATYLLVRAMKYRKKAFIDRRYERKVKNYMIAVITLTLIPSVFLAYRIVQETVFDSNADRYVKTVFMFEDTQMIDYTKKYKTKEENASISVLLIGEPLSQDVIDNAKAQMLNFGLQGTELYVRQASGGEKIDITTIQTSYSELLNEKNRKISELQQLVERYSSNLEAGDIAREAATVVGNIDRLLLSRELEYDTDGGVVDTMLVCVVSMKDQRKPFDQDKLTRWLSVRTKSNNIKVYVEKSSRRPISMIEQQPEESLSEKAAKNAAERLR